MAMKELVRFYKVLRSDITGSTSDEAEKAWQAISAKRLTPRNRKHLDRSDYVLGASNLIDSLLESATPVATYDLGDGYTLDRYSGGVFKFVFDGEIVGGLNVTRDADSLDSEFPERLASVQDVMVYPQIAMLRTGSHRGKGLYRRALPILKKLYGGIRSSHHGATSDEAAKAWKKVGARTGLTSDDPRKYGGSWYSLESRSAQLISHLLTKAPSR